LKLDWKQILALRSRLKSEKFTGIFKCVNKMKLVLDGGESEMHVVLNEILHTTPNLIEMIMGIYNCNSPEIFLAQNPKIAEDGMLLHLRILALSYVSTIRSIQSQNSSWLNTICEKVHDLNVFQCRHLETIGVHSTSTLSFSLLKKVDVLRCRRLQYLFTSSVAKNLVNLKEIIVQECKSLKEIIAKEGDEEGEGEDNSENEIIFVKLEKLSLGSLGKLESFYTGSCTLNFPSLRKVEVNQCFNSKIFRHRDKVPPKFTVIIDRIRCRSDKKPLIMQQVEEEVSRVSLVTTNSLDL